MRRLLHFLLLGGALFVAVRLLDPAGERVRVLHLSPERLAAREREAAAHTGRPLDARERRMVLDEAISDEILFREALAAGLAESDTIVRRRLVRNMRFVGGAEGDDDELVRQALALGMQETDIVVRRRLVQRMEMAIEAGAREPAPGEDELRAWLAAHAERYALPDRIALEHVFFSRDLRGAAARADAAAALAAGPDRAVGDPFLAPRVQPLQSTRELEKLFGPDFAEAVRALPEGTWSGPVASSFGFHLVRVTGREAGGLPPLEAVRTRVRHDLLAERGQRAVRDVVRALRAHYVVDLPASGPVPASR